MSGCKLNFSSRDEEVVNGVALLKDFILSISKSRSGKSRGRDVGQVINSIVRKISDGNYVFLTSISTLVEANLLNAWDSYRDRFERWLRDFINSYCLDANIDDLPPDYRAKVALEFSILLTKDLLENHLNDSTPETRGLLVNEPVITWLGVSLSLADVIGALYPYVLSMLTSGIISYGTEPIRLVSQYSDNLRRLYEKTYQEGKKGGSPYKIYKLIYLPLTSIGLASEFTIPAILEQGAGGFKYRFAITGMGHNFMNSMVLILSQSFNRVYYEYVLNNLIGVNHAFRVFIRHYLRSIFSVDEYSVAKGLIDEYFKYVKDANISRYFSYNISDALKDISMTTLTLLSQYYELQSGNMPGSYDYAKYLPAILVDKPIEEVIRYAIKRLWIYSQS